MPNDATSPYATYLSHLEKGELAYQFSPAANRAVFFPRVLCPYTGSDKLEWRVSKGRGTVYATTIVHPAEGAPFNVALIDVEEGFRLMSRVEDVAPDAGEDRHAGEIPRAQAGRRERSDPRVHPGGRVMDGLKRGAAAIVGVAESDLGQVADGMSPMDLVAQGTQRALADCGLTLKDVDGLFCAMTQARMSIVQMIEYLGIQPKFIGSSMTGGSSFEFHVAQAAAAIQAGLCNVAVIAYGSTQRSVGRRQSSAREINPYETPFNPFMPTSAYALAASRHMHRVRHDARAAGRGRGRGAQVGAAQSSRVGEEGPHRRGRAEVAHDLVSVHGARLLPRHRRRRRDRDDVAPSARSR